MKPLLCCLALLTSTAGLIPGWAAFPELHLKNICDDQIYAPTNITNAGDGSGRLFICDQIGKIHIFKNGALQPKPFLDLSASGANKVFVGASLTSYSERGLLGMAFHPDYANPSAPGYRRFYLNYTGPASVPTAYPSTPLNCVTVIAEFQVSETDPNVALPGSERILLTYGQPQSNHNGGQLAFGPDKKLYIGSGDGGGANDNAAGHTGGPASSGNLGNAQDKTKLLGKILRIDPLGTNGQGGQYGIPADNPFIAGTNGERPEIYAFGLRNPWRFCFDQPPSGPARLFCADVGQDNVEEIDLITSGGNYGWRVKEGSVDFDSTAPNGGGSLIGPIAEYRHPNASLPGTAAMPIYGTSITGGYVYRGTAIPGLQGKYVFADYYQTASGLNRGILLGLEETTPGSFGLSQIAPLETLPPNGYVYAFGLDEAGEMYVAAKTTSGVTSPTAGKPAGILFKIVPLEPVLTHYEEWLTRYLAPGFYLEPEGDLDNDGISNLHEYAYGLDPKTPDDDGVFTSGEVSVTGGVSHHRLTFRRDSAATDLTYQLQSSPDLSVWTTLATSTAGAAPVMANGSSLVSDEDLGDGLHQVTVEETLPPGETSRRFVRLHVLRANPGG